MLFERGFLRPRYTLNPSLNNEDIIKLYGYSKDEIDFIFEIINTEKNYLLLSKNDNLSYDYIHFKRKLFFVFLFKIPKVVIYRPYIFFKNFFKKFFYYNRKSLSFVNFKKNYFFILIKVFLYKLFLVINNFFKLNYLFVKILFLQLILFFLNKSLKFINYFFNKNNFIYFFLIFNRIFIPNFFFKLIIICFFKFKKILLNFFKKCLGLFFFFFIFNLYCSILQFYLLVNNKYLAHLPLEFIQISGIFFI